MYSIRNGVMYCYGNKMFADVSKIKPSSEKSKDVFNKINKLIKSFNKQSICMLSNDDMLKRLKKEKEYFESIKMPSLSKVLLSWDYHKNDKWFIFPETEVVDFNFDISNAMLKENFEEGYNESFLLNNKKHWKDESFDWEKAVAKSLHKDEQNEVLNLVEKIRALEKFYGRKFKF